MFEDAVHVIASTLDRRFSMVGHRYTLGIRRRASGQRIRNRIKYTTQGIRL